MASPSRSAPFLDRELDGQVLLSELALLRQGGVTQRILDACGRAMDSLEDLAPRDAADQLRALAVEDFEEAPALAQVLVRWALKLKQPDDVKSLQRHFRKLALTSALLQALWKASVRLNPRRRA